MLGYSIQNYNPYNAYYNWNQYTQFNGFQPYQNWANSFPFQVSAAPTYQNWAGSSPFSFAPTAQPSQTSQVSNKPAPVPFKAAPKTEPQKEEKGLSTGAKWAIGIGVAALVAGGIYLVTRGRAQNVGKLLGEKVPSLSENRSVTRVMFEETDEAFAGIVKNSEQEFLELSKKTGDDFINSAFELIKRKMGIEGSPITMQITNDYESCFHASREAKICISRLKPQNPSGGNEEFINEIVHELNHMLQAKESYVGGKLGYNTGVTLEPKFAEWVDSIPEYFQRHEGSIAEKAKNYADNFKNYIAYDGTNLSTYKSQLVEAESFRRGELVRDLYLDLINRHQGVC